MTYRDPHSLSTSMTRLVKVVWYATTRRCCIEMGGPAVLTTTYLQTGFVCHRWLVSCYHQTLPDWTSKLPPSPHPLDHQRSLISSSLCTTESKTSHLKTTTTQNVNTLVCSWPLDYATITQVILLLVCWYETISQLKLIQLLQGTRKHD